MPANLLAALWDCRWLGVASMSVFLGVLIYVAHQWGFEPAEYPDVDLDGGGASVLMVPAPGELRVSDLIPGPS